MSETVQVYVTYEEISSRAQIRFQVTKDFIGPADVDVWFGEHDVDTADTAYLALEVITQNRAILGLSGRIDWEYLWDVDPTVLGILLAYGKEPDTLIKALWYHISIGTPLKEVIQINFADECKIYNDQAEMFREWAKKNGVPQEAIEFIDVDDVLDNRYDTRERLDDGRYIIMT